MRKIRKLIKWGTIGFVGLIVLSVIGAAMGGSSSSTSSNNAADTSAAPAKSEQKESNSATSSSASTSDEPECGSRATDDCTPRLKMGKSVRVDALYWDVTNVETASEIGDMQFGLGEKADGTFVVLDLSVRSAKDESVTLTDNSIELVTADGKTYKADSDGTIAAMGNGDNPLWFEDIGPDATMTSKVVFDLPASALNKKLSVRFNELGFGTTHGFIKLPSLSA